MAHAQTAHPSRRVFREAPNGAEPLALDRRLFGDFARPTAWGLFFDLPEPLAFDPSTVGEDGIACLHVRGPLEHHSGWWANYEDLVSATEAALACPEVRAVVHIYDTPGGVCAGVNEAAKSLRATADRAGKPLLAWVCELAASAGYWLAAACDEIWMPSSATVGSIGVIACVADETEALSELGIKLHYVTTGKRKADGYPGNAVTSETIASVQRGVDHLGGLFFRSVARSRGTTPALIESFEAAVFHGEEALDVGLVDGVSSWVEFLGTLRGAVGASVGSTLLGPSGTTRSKDSTMALKLVQAQVAYDTATGAVDTARLAAEADPSEKNLATWKLAIAAKGTARKAVDEAKAKGRTVEQEKYERKVVRDDEEEEAADEAPAKEDEEESTGASDGAAMGPEKEEDALAAAYQAGTSKLLASLPEASPLALYTPDRLVRAAEKALGVTGIRAVFGALSQVPKLRKSEADLTARVAKLEQKDREGEASALIAKAKREGRVASKEDIAKLEAFGAQDVEILRGVIAMLPKRMRTDEDGPLVPREGAQGQPVAVSDDAEKMLAHFTAGMSAEDAAKFRASTLQAAAQSNGAGIPKH